MPDYILTLVETRWETPSAKSFLFLPNAPPERKAGQYLRLYLDAPGDPKGNARMFTMSSAPTEERIMITTRVVNRSPFKEVLTSLSPGTELKARIPMGNFTLHEDATKRAVFLAGGIGITPFRSIIRHASDTGLPQDILLLYSAQTPEEIVFRRELETLAEEGGRFQMAVTVTRPQESEQPWDGPTGRIDAAFIRQNAGSLDDSIVYVAGPPALVEGLLKVVAELGCPKDRTRAERFTGY